MILPPEIFVVQSVVGIENFQVSGQLFRFEFPGVDVRMGRGVLAVIGTAVNYGNHVKIQDFEKHFRHVIFADGILEWQVKFVRRLDHFVAPRFRMKHSVTLEDEFTVATLERFSFG